MRAFENQRVSVNGPMNSIGCSYVDCVFVDDLVLTFNPVYKEAMLYISLSALNKRRLPDLQFTGVS